MIRVMIVLLLAGSAFLGWKYKQHEAVLARYQAALEPDGEIERRMRSTQRLAFEYAQLQRAAARSGGKIDASSNSSVFNKIQTIAQMDDVAFGSISVSEPRERENLDGYQDIKYQVEHSDSKHYVDRARLANLFYQLEQSHRSLKVTGLTIRSAPKTPAPSEIPNDEWDVDFEITLREKK